MGGVMPALQFAFRPLAHRPSNPAAQGSTYGQDKPTSSQSQLQPAEPSGIQIPPAPVQPLSLQRSAVHSVECRPSEL